MKRSLGTHHTELTDIDALPARTLAEVVYRRFRQDILSGKLSPDAPLRSDELRKTYNIGISPLREALSRLVSEQLVIANGQRGFRVAPLTVEDVIDTMETRIVIESEALSRCIKYGNIHWESAVVSSYHRLSYMEGPKTSGEQAEDWAKHHREFHMALLSGCRSRWLMLLASSLFDHAERHRMRAFTVPARVTKRDPAAEHRQLMKAALARNAKAAIAALDHHYRTTAEIVVKELSKGGQATVPPTTQKKRTASK